MNDHIIIIGLIIAIIVSIQIKVFLATKNKISLFKWVIPKSIKFETVQVYIAEDEIKNIKPLDILRNEKKYSTIPVKKDIFVYPLDSKEPNLVHNESPSIASEMENFRATQKTENSEILEFEDPEEIVHIKLGFEKKRVKRKKLNLWENEGWTVINNEERINQ